MFGGHHWRLDRAVGGGSWKGHPWRLLAARARACPKIVANCRKAVTCWSSMWVKGAAGCCRVLQGATGAGFCRASMSLVAAWRAALAEETCGIL
jgi:hypothetical protein